MRNTTADLTDEKRATREALSAELGRLEKEYAEVEDLPEEIDQRLSEIEKALEVFDEYPVVYDPAEIPRAGAFVSIDSDGDLRIERAMSVRRMSLRSNQSGIAMAIPLRPACREERPSMR